MLGYKSNYGRRRVGHFEGRSSRIISCTLRLMFCALVLAPATVFAGDADSANDSLSKEIKALKLEVDALKKEVKQNNASSTSKGPLKQTAEWKFTNSKVHLSGYADVGFTDEESKNSNFNVGTFAPIFHYSYRDRVLLESELEFEIGEDGQTETNLEYLSIDVFLNDYATLIGGKFLSPIGQFRQNLHPSWINKLPSAPVGFGHGEAAPTEEIGAQLRGAVPLGERRVNYAFYVSNGPEVVEVHDDEAARVARGNDASEASSFELETGNGDGNGNKVIGGRVGFLPVSNFEIGLSGAFGDASSDEGDRDYEVYGVDFALHYDDLELRGEFVNTTLGPVVAGASDDELEAYYVQAAYLLPVLNKKLEPVVRWANYENLGLDRTQWTIGLNYVLYSNTIVKLAYDISDFEQASDSNRFMAQLTFGF